MNRNEKTEQEEQTPKKVYVAPHIEAVDLADAILQAKTSSGGSNGNGGGDS